MDRPETIQLFQRAHNEIVGLRQRIAELEPQAHAYATIAILARQSEPSISQGYGEDLAWRLKQAVEMLEAEREAEKRP